MSANSKQIGGSHYQANIQHWDLIAAFGVGYLEGCATKYLTRYTKKNGVQDVEKAIHYIDKLIELEGQRFNPVAWVKEITGRLLFLNLRRQEVPIQVVARFVEENNVSPSAETAIIYLLRWQTIADLQIARDAAERALNKLKAQKEAEERIENRRKRDETAELPGWTGDTTGQEHPFGYDPEDDACGCGQCAAPEPAPAAVEWPHLGVEPAGLVSDAAMAQETGVMYEGHD